MARLILILTAAALSLPVHAARADALPETPAGDHGRGAVKKPSGTGVRQGVYAERKKRLLLRALDDLLVEKKFALEDVRELEQRIDAVTPLESPRRKDDFQALLNGYKHYLDLLAARNVEFERGLVQLAAIRSIDEMAAEEKDLVRAFGEEDKRYAIEEKRLSGIYDRRRVLQSRLFILEERSVRVRATLNEKQRSPSEKEKAKQEAKLLREESRLARTEFNSLPAVDENTLRHFAEMIERRRWASEQLALKTEEYEALSGVIAAQRRSVPGDETVIAEAYRKMIRTYERGIGRLAKMSDELDRKQSWINPAETLQQTGQTSELAALHQRLRERFEERTKQLKALAGAYEADLAEILSSRH